MDIRHVDEKRGHGKEEKTRPFPTGLLVMCHGLFVMFGEKVDRRMTTFLWCFHFLEFRLGVRFVFLCVSSLCKEKSPRLLRTEVSDNVPEYSGLFCCLNKLLFVFPNLCRDLLVS